jgi:hypothetical protein
VSHLWLEQIFPQKVVVVVQLLVSVVFAILVGSAVVFAQFFLKCCVHVDGGAC